MLLGRSSSGSGACRHTVPAGRWGYRAGAYGGDSCRSSEIPLFVESVESVRCVPIRLLDNSYDLDHAPAFVIAREQDHELNSLSDQHRIGWSSVAHGQAIEPVETLLDGVRM